MDLVVVKVGCVIEWMVEGVEWICEECWLGKKVLGYNLSISGRCSLGCWWG